jgi:hypothetical protein
VVDSSCCTQGTGCQGRRSVRRAARVDRDAPRRSNLRRDSVGTWACRDRSADHDRPGPSGSVFGLNRRRRPTGGRKRVAQRIRRPGLAPGRWTVVTGCSIRRHQQRVQATAAAESERSSTAALSQNPVRHARDFRRNHHAGRRAGPCPRIMCFRDGVDRINGSSSVI